MAKSFLTDINLNRNVLLNAKIQAWGATPSGTGSPDGSGAAITGQISSYAGALYIFNGTAWVTVGTSGAVTSVAGTANQITSSGTTSVTLSLATAFGDTVNPYASKTANFVLAAPNGSNGVPTFRALVSTDVGLGNVINESKATMFTSPTFTGTVAAFTSAGIAMGNNKITGLGTPTADSDAATKLYVDSTAQGIDWKASVVAATTTNGTLATAYANGSVIDGVTLATGDRILIKDQTAGAENGIYTVNATGAPTRASDADSVAEISPGFAVFVEAGTNNSDCGFVLTNNGGITLGSTALVFTQFTGLGQVTAGNGLTKTGNTLNVGGTTDRITVGSDTVDIASTYAGQATITTLGTVATGTWNGSVIAGAYGGTGVANTGKTITLGGSLTHSGAFTQEFVASANTIATLPSGTITLVDLAATQTLSNKTFTAPVLGAATATTINKVTITAPATGAVLTIADTKTFTVNHGMTLATTTGSNSSTFTFPSTSATIARTDAGQTFTGNQSFTSTPYISDGIDAATNAFNFVPTVTTLSIATGSFATLRTINIGSPASGTGNAQTINLGVNSTTTATSLINIGGSTSTTTTITGDVKVPTVGTSGFVKLGTGGQMSSATLAYADLPTNVGRVSRTVTGAGSGTGSSIAVTHGLGTNLLNAQLFDTGSTAGTATLVEVDVASTSTTTTFTFSSSQTLSNYSYVITG
jgi:hypothetical protein